MYQTQDLMSIEGWKKERKRGVGIAAFEGNLHFRTTTGQLLTRRKTELRLKKLARSITSGNGIRCIGIRTKQRTCYKDKKTKCPYTEALHYEILTQGSQYKDSPYTKTPRIKLFAKWVKEEGVSVYGLSVYRDPGV